MATSHEPEPELALAVAETVSRILRVPTQMVTSSGNLQSQGWSSLIALEVMVALEARFSVRLGLQEFQAARTSEDLVDLVQRRRTAG